MLDKNELQELLVRLKLGTVSVDNAIEEIEKNFYEESEPSGRFPKGCVFEDVIFCGGKNAAYLKNAVETRLEKRIPFICLGLESACMSELAKVFDGVEFIYDAGMALKIYDKAVSMDFKAVIVTSSPALCRVCREAETVLGLTGIEVETVAGVHPGKFSAVKNMIGEADAVIAASDRGSLAEAAGAFFPGPVVALPLSGGAGAALNGFSGMFEAISSPWGVPSVNIDCGFAAAMAVYRLARLRG